jgi:intracellular multiplication protein IcmP
MAGQQGGGQGGGGIGTMGFLLMLATAVVLIALLWYTQTAFCAKILYGIKHAEAAVVVYLFKGINGVITLFGIPAIKVGSLQNWYYWFSKNATPEFYKTAKFSQVILVSHLVGQWLRYPAIAILLVLAYYLKFKHPGDQFRRTFTMKRLRSTEVELWPFITPILDENLVKTPLDKGPWAMAKQPLDFCKENKILHTGADKVGITTWDVNTSEAEGIFSQQLGPLWNGLERQPVYIQALAIIFVAKLQRDAGIERRFIHQIAASAKKGGRLDMTGIKELVSKYADSKPIRWLETRHAYRTTLMASLLEMARSEGVLATAEFLWLKPVDRRMWYMLNAVGRQTAPVEVAGAFSHWQTELKVRRPLRTPAVNSAARALKEAVSQILYVGREESWRTSSAD